MPHINVTIPSANTLDYADAIQSITDNLELDNLQKLAELAQTVPDVNNKIKMLLTNFGHLIK